MPHLGDACVCVYGGHAWPSLCSSQVCGGLVARGGEECTHSCQLCLVGRQVHLLVLYMPVRPPFSHLFALFRPF